MKMPHQTPTAVAFFYRNAGYSHPSDATPAQQRAHRLNGARTLAHAEEWARNAGGSFVWSVDQDSTSADWSDETPAWEQWQCAMRDENGRCVASLHGIDFGRDGSPWNDNYRRVVEAELAREALGERE